jgi:hypothetical protein
MLSGYDISLMLQNVTGVKFLYECVMGLRKHEGQGCILADEMYMFNLSVCMQSLIFRFQGSGENPPGLFVHLTLFLLVEALDRQFLLCGHSSVSSPPHICYNLQAGHRAESLRWRWASNRQGLDRMPRVAGQCLFLFFSHARYLLTCEQNWRAEFHKW